MFIGGGYIVDMETWPMKWSVINWLESLHCTTVKDISIHSIVVQSCIICELFLVPGEVVSVTSYWLIWPLWSVIRYTILNCINSTLLNATVCIRLYYTAVTVFWLLKCTKLYWAVLSPYAVQCCTGLFPARIIAPIKVNLWSIFQAGTISVNILPNTTLRCTAFHSIPHNISVV